MEAARVSGSRAEGDAIERITTATANTNLRITVLLATSLGAVAEIVEHRHAVGFRPDADLAGIHPVAVAATSGLRAVTAASLSPGTVSDRRAPVLRRAMRATHPGAPPHRRLQPERAT